MNKINILFAASTAWVFIPSTQGKEAGINEPHSIAQHAPVTKFDIENPSTEESMALSSMYTRNPLNKGDFSYAQSLAAGIAGEVF